MGDLWRAWRARRAPVATVPIRVLLVDDHPLLRDGIRLSLQSGRGVTVVGEAAAVDDALALVPQCRPDVVVSDIRMPVRSGIDLVGALAEQATGVRVLLLSMLDDARLIGRALAAGAAGYVRKDAQASTLIEAIRVVAAGGCHVDPAVAAQLAGAAQTPCPPSPLTPREVAVLRLIAQGLGSREISEALEMSVRTVETHRLRIRRKLHLEGDVALSTYLRSYPELLRG